MVFRLGMVAVAALGLALVCCAGGYNHNERLRDEVNQFNSAVRWGQFFKASRQVREADRSQWLASHRDWGQDLQVADYEVVDTELLEEEDAALVRVVMSWYRLSESMLQTTMLTQRWEREGRDWQLASEEYEEGAPL